MNIISIDPGNLMSAYVLMDSNYTPIEFAKIPNEDLLTRIQALDDAVVPVAVIEKMVRLGMPVGQEVFDTCMWYGRFHQELVHQYIKVEYVTRREEKLNLCGSTQAKDGNIIQALKDRFGHKGTIAQKGFFHGFKADCWQAFSVGCTYLDKKYDRGDDSVY